MISFDAQNVQVVATGLQFPEGPVACDDGSVLVPEIEGGTLTRVEKDGTKSSILCGGGPNGAAFGPDGAVYVCNDGGFDFMTEGEIRFPHALAAHNTGGYLQRVDLQTGDVRTVFPHVEGAAMGSLNDIVFDTQGCCYVVDTGRGALYYADPLGGAIETVADGLVYPNGMGLSPDGRKLYVSETYTGHVFSWDVTAAGRLENRVLLYATGGAHNWDGLAVDGAGNICIANLQKSGITALSPAGHVLGEFVTPQYDPYITNICFGGPSGGTAYVCSAGRGVLYSLPWPWPGLRLNYAR